MAGIESVLVPLVWKLAKPILKMGAKALRDKWAKELAEEKAKEDKSCDTSSSSSPSH